MNMYYLSNLLLIIGTLLLVIEILYISIKYLILNKISLKNITGYDIAKLLIDRNKIQDISIIEATTGNKNSYNINRNSIRLSKNIYNNTNIFALSISLYIAGCTILKNNKNKYINLYNKLFSKISYISISSIIILIVSKLFKGYYSLIGLLILIIMFIYSYIRKSISNDNIEIISKQINRLKIENKDKIIEILKIIDNIYNITIIICILQITRLLIYIIN